MVVFEDGKAIVERDPHPALTRVLGYGYRFRFRIENDTEQHQTLVVEVLRESVVVAAAEFTDDGQFAFCQTVLVDEGHRRKGIANALYVFAEKVFRRPLYNFWDGNSSQSEAAKLLWAQPDRPFGNPPDGR